MTKLFLSTSLFALAASAAVASPDAMTAEEARHLIARTGFGASPAEVEALTGQSAADAVAQILARVDGETATPMPAWTQHWPYPVEEVFALGTTADELFFTNRYIQMEELAAWWMAEMVATDSPLTERLTLFWHDHFATSFEASENAHWISDQHQMFRAHAAGSFTQMATAILTDPAMLTYLTNEENSKENPNENLAREYLELFTLGEGRGYTEADIREAARALTGHSISDVGTPRYAFYAEDHDFGDKTILGHTGAFDAADLPALALGHPEFGPYIVEKLWRVFISDQPDPAEVQRLSELWKENNLELKPLLEAMFLSDAFWDPANRGRIVKSPIELLVGTIRSTGITVPANHLIWAAEDLGQTLFFPPNVAGWPTGPEWITDAAALARSTTLIEAAEYFGNDMEPYAPLPLDDGLPVLGESGVEAGPEDLRVGQAFATWGEVWDEGDGEGGGIGLTLYDVSYAGETWRSIPLWLEVSEEEGAFAAIFTEDCAPGCFATVEREEEEDEEDEGWIYFSPELYAEVSWPGGLSETDLGLLRAIGSHLPALMAATEEQATWQSYWEDLMDEDIPSYDEVAPIAVAYAKDSQAHLGQSDGALVMALSQPGLLGVNGLGMLQQSGALEEVMESYYEELYESAPQRPAQPAVTFESAEAWAGSLPEGLTPESLLLAVPLTSQEIVPGLDPEEALTRILLSPEYQVK